MNSSAISRIRIAFVVGILAALPCLAAAKKKKEPTPPATPAPANAETSAESAPAAGTCSVRLWKEDFPGGKSVRVEFQAKGDKKVLIHFEPPATGAYFTDYAQIPSGAGLVLFSSEGGEAGKSSPAPIILAPDSFSTLLLREKDGTPLVELLDDAPAGADAASAELTVRNFARNLVEVQVKAGDSLNSRMRAPECFLNIRGLERQRCQLDTTTRDGAGKESHWTTEVDFTKCRKATLLIYADPYGRIRPRVALDGQAPPSEAANSEPAR